MKRKGRTTPRKADNRIHLGGWRRGSTAKWKKDYQEFNPKHEKNYK